MLTPKSKKVLRQLFFRSEPPQSPGIASSSEEVSQSKVGAPNSAEPLQPKLVKSSHEENDEDAVSRLAWISESFLPSFQVSIPAQKRRNPFKGSSSLILSDEEESAPWDLAHPLIPYIRNSVIGAYDMLSGGPFGSRRMCYADYTASGRALEFIERYMLSEVLPMYANTHTEASATGLHTTRLREEARELILKSVNGNAAEDVVLFVHAGTTGAIRKMIEVCALSVPKELDKFYNMTQRCIPPDERPIVLVGPIEHHSNELQWRDTIADVVRIPLTGDGCFVDLEVLEEECKRYAHRPLRIGTFSAGSNVSGLLVHPDPVIKVLRRYDFYNFWDYAAAGPYVGIDMSSKDAIFLSPHKFVGGPGSAGILVAKRHMFHNAVPVVGGGGTVDFVTDQLHVFTEDIESREEGGTPAILDCIRAGLVFQLKDAVGPGVIERIENIFIRRAIRRWSQCPNIQIIGHQDAPRLAIVAFNIRLHTLHWKGKGVSQKELPRGSLYSPDGIKSLHYNFVVALLNDLFGIQARGGCSCAGPYGGYLYEIPEKLLFEGTVFVLSTKKTSFKPGWCRINFNFFFSIQQVDYIIEAIEWVATHGWKFLPLYRMEEDSALWRHIHAKEPQRASLFSIQYDTSQMSYPCLHHVSRTTFHYGENLRIANQLAQEIASPVGIKALVKPGSPSFLGMAAEAIFPYLLPTQAYEWLQLGKKKANPRLPSVVIDELQQKFYAQFGTFSPHSAQLWNLDSQREVIRRVGPAFDAYYLGSEPPEAKARRMAESARRLHQVETSISSSDSILVKQDSFTPIPAQTNDRDIATLSEIKFDRESGWQMMSKANILTNSTNDLAARVLHRARKGTTG